MKRTVPFSGVIIVAFMLTVGLLLTSCDTGGGGNGGGGTTYSAGDSVTRTADGVSFVMAYVPGGLTCPTGRNDEGSATVADAYWIGETEVTYELWDKVYDWATDAARGANIYTFANAGRQGGDPGSGPVGTNQHPVTMVNWRDSMVWCNALTEWYNAQSGTSYECVYSHEGSVIRDSRDTNATACDGVVESSTAKGFRLLSSDEYELAARYRNGTDWTYGDHASGDDSGACYDDRDILGGLGMSTVFGDYAVYSGNSGRSTSPVKGSRTANALGLYDMSGNVWEWCYDLIGSDRVDRGGAWSHTADVLRVGIRSPIDPDIKTSDIGFRFARTAD